MSKTEIKHIIDFENECNEYRCRHLELDNNQISTAKKIIDILAEDNYSIKSAVDIFDYCKLALERIPVNSKSECHGYW